MALAMITAFATHSFIFSANRPGITAEELNLQREKLKKAPLTEKKTAPTKKPKGSFAPTKKELKEQMGRLKKVKREPRAKEPTKMELFTQELQKRKKGLKPTKTRDRSAPQLQSIKTTAQQPSAKKPVAMKKTSSLVFMNKSTGPVRISYQIEGTTKKMTVQPGQ